MNKEKYNISELIIFYLILLNGCTGFILNNISLSLSISMIIGYFLISLLLKKYNRVIIFISIIYLILFSLLIIINTSSIINIYLTPKYNLLLISLLFIFISYFLSNKGLKSIMIASNLLFIIYIIVLIITILSSINNINLLNYKNIINNKIDIINPLLYLITPLIFLSIIPKHNINNLKKYNITIKKTYIFFSIYLLFKIIFIDLVIGLQSPNIISNSELLLFNSINIKYIKDLLIINILIERFILLSITVYYIKYNIKKRFNYRF